MKNNLPKIVFTEGGDERVIEAIKKLLAEGKCHPIVIGGDPEAFAAQFDASCYTFLSVDPTELNELSDAASAKGKVFEVTDAALAQGAALVRDGEADGIVAGADTSTDDVFRVYLKTIGVRTHESQNHRLSRVSSLFLMEKGNNRLIFTDCALNPTSTAEQLAEAAFLAAKFAQRHKIEPRVAFLSFQTRGNARHPLVEPVSRAVEIARDRYHLVCDGPLQFDAAFMPDVAEKKVGSSDVAGKATIYVFPDLSSGNIGYKVAERLGGFRAIGPLFEGFAKPAYDLSRGCSVGDIVEVAHMVLVELVTEK